MQFIGNLFWLLLGGLIEALAWCFLGVVLCITIIFIPLGVKCFKIAGLIFSPFGKEVSVSFDEHPVANIIWMMLIGWECFLGAVTLGLLFCITIVGIPLGKQWFKVAKLSLLPFGADVD